METLITIAVVAAALYVWLIWGGANAAPTFPPGCVGTISKGGITIYAASWDFSWDVDLLAYDTFSKITSLGYYFKMFVAGLASGDLNVRGFWDNTASQHPSGPTLLIRPAQTPAITITYDGSVGYSLTGIISKINPKTAASGTADFDFNYKMMSVTAFGGQT